MEPPAYRELGFSLVESVVAIAILGLIVAAMVGGLATTITTSDIHRQQSEVNTVMVSAAELVKSTGYVRCARMPGNANYAPDSALPAGWPAGPSGAIKVTVGFWNPTTSTFDLATCHDNDGSSPFPTQLVTIAVKDPGNRADASIEIVKRGPQIPAVTGVTPTSGPAGTSVKITGRGFAGFKGVTGYSDATGPVNAAVYFGSAKAAALTLDSDGQITATAPPGPGGAIDITVATPGGTSTLVPTDKFTIT